MWPLDRESPIPLYLQIRQQLVSLISDWPDPERRFPTDEEFVGAFGVSKATVRQAITDLTRSGLLTRRRGAGTYVVPPMVETLRPNTDLEEKYQLAGGVVQHKLLSFKTRAPTAIEARTLETGTDRKVLSLRRLRSVTHVPIAIDDRVMTVDTANRMKFTESMAERSIIDLVRRTLALSRAAWELHARLAGERDGALLHICPSDPILARTLIYYEEDRHPIMMGETRHRSDMLRCGFEMDIGGSVPNDSVRSWTSEALLSVSPPS